MTVFAEVAGIDMEFMFACGIDTVVTALAVVCDVLMFKFRRGPGGTDVMALFAIVMCGYMFIDFTPGGLSVVAAFAVMRDACVIHTRGNGKIGGQVAVVTIVV